MLIFSLTSMRLKCMCKGALLEWAQGCQPKTFFTDKLQTFTDN